MNRRFVCQMTFRQWQQDGWEEGGTEEEEECGGVGGGECVVGSDHMSDVWGFCGAPEEQRVSRSRPSDLR